MLQLIFCIDKTLLNRLNMRNILISLIIFFALISCIGKHTDENSLVFAYTIEDDSLRYIINNFVSQIENPDSIFIPVLEIIPKDNYVYYKIYRENNAFALMNIPDLFFAKADGRIVAITYGEKPEGYCDRPDFTIKKDYAWNVLKCIFPEQYIVYKQGLKIETPKYKRAILFLTYKHGKCCDTEYIGELR